MEEKVRRGHDVEDGRDVQEEEEEDETNVEVLGER